MIKTLFVTGIMIFLFVMGISTAHPQEISLDEAIHNSAWELSAGIEETARVAVLSMHSDSAELSHYLGNEMINAVADAGNFTVLSQDQISQVLRDFTFSEKLNNTTAQTFGRFLDVHFVVTGEFENVGGNFRLNTRLVDVATAVARETHTAFVQTNDLIASLIFVGQIQIRTPREPKPRPRICNNWLSFELSYLGAGIRYERNLNENFSLGFIIFANLIPENGGNYFFQYVDVSSGGLLATRYYPGWSTLYFELGMGWGYVDQWDYQFHEYAYGLLLKPSIGFRFGGYEKAFFVNPFISVPIAFGFESMTVPFFEYTYSEKVKASFRAGVGLGFSW